MTDTRYKSEHILNNVFDSWWGRGYDWFKVKVKTVQIKVWNKSLSNELQMKTKLAFPQGRENRLNHFWRRHNVQLSVPTIYIKNCKIAQRRSAGLESDNLEEDTTEDA